MPTDPIAAPSGAPAMIEVKNLTKIFGLTEAVKDVSFSVARGEIMGFLGPNGAGKTTTMRIMTCYTPATAGTVRVGGFDTRRQSREVRRTIGYLPESAPLYLDMEVRDYLNFMSEIKGHPRSKRRTIVGEAIEECGLESVIGRIIRNLSKGYRQRVGLAQALLGNPDVLILDEPTVGLDPAQIAEIRDLIRGMAGRRTVILSTHILPEVSMTCQRVVIINNGHIEAEGTPEHLVSRVGGANLVLMTIEGAPGAVEPVLKAVPGVKAVTIERPVGKDAALWRIEAAEGKNPRPDLAEAVIKNGFRLLDMQTSGLSLEDVFLRVISAQREVA
ncbi:ABC transporter ATP-binding protein [bacterium]|nr:ABC transporter ATP-binding protein [bacterium]